MTRRRVFVTVFALLALTWSGTALAVEVGTKAPDFTVINSDGKEVKLTDLTAKGSVAIYTFIQAFTGP